VAAPLDLRPLGKAIAALEAALGRAAQAPDDDIPRDASIQRFEFTYELSYKMLKRFLEATSPSPGQIDKLAFQDLIRTGSERDVLLNGWPRWKDYRAARSITSYTYDEQKAREVFAVIPAFLEEARHLYKRLSEELPR
jgi:nucleotidyltransferase substrate binding protein (TIGR01987 family)